MTPDELEIFHNTFCLHARDVMMERNARYSADAQDALRNARISADICRVAPSLGLLMRVSDKITRLGTLLNGLAQAEEVEGILDTCMDGVNYLVLIAAALTGKGQSDESQESFYIDDDGTLVRVDSNELRSHQSVVG